MKWSAVINLLIQPFLSLIGLAVKPTGEHWLHNMVNVPPALESLALGTLIGMYLTGGLLLAQQLADHSFQQHETFEEYSQ